MLLLATCGGANTQKTDTEESGISQVTEQSNTTTEDTEEERESKDVSIPEGDTKLVEGEYKVGNYINPVVIW